MSHLKDMEELLFTINDLNSRDYMKESMACYMASAYRASVVLSFIALFDDVLKKLGELGKVNSKARLIFESASKKRDEQDVFESYMIDQLKSNALLSGLDVEFLDKLRWFRNKAAHPSGHHSSAEEARYVFSEVIGRFLSRPILSTTQLADEVLMSLVDTNFFPSPKIEIIKKVVAKSLANIHSEVYPYLILKLLEKAIKGSSESMNNARYFMSGMARLDDIHLNKVIQKYIIEKKSPDKAYLRIILTLLASNGKLFIGLDDVTYQRIGALLKERITTVSETLDHSLLGHPANTFIGLFDECPAELVLDKLSVEFNQFLDRFLYSAIFLKYVGKYPFPLRLVVAKLIARSKSDDFGKANEFVQNIDSIDRILVDSLKPVESFEIIIGVMRAANAGAFSAIDERNSHFINSPKVRVKAKKYLDENGPAAKALAHAILGKAQEVSAVLKFLEPK